MFTSFQPTIRPWIRLTSWWSRRTEPVVTLC